MARISLNPPRTLAFRLAERYTRRKYGAALEPATAVAHNMQVARSYAVFELQIERWHSLDAGLKDLAALAAAAQIGCAWCLDFGYWEATMRHHVPAAKVRAIPHWRASASSNSASSNSADSNGAGPDGAVFTELERLVLEYAEAMTQTPPAVTDELVAGLSRHLNEAQLVELTAIVAVENLRSRINAALDLTAQGFKDRCELAPGQGSRMSEADGAAAH